MSLIFNTLSRFIIAFLPRSKHLLILWLQSLSTVKLEPKKIKSVIASTFSPFICHEVMGPGAIIFIFQAAFSLSSFTLIKRLFSSSLLSAIRVLFICISGVGCHSLFQKIFPTHVLNPSRCFTIWGTSEAEYNKYAVYIMENVGLDDLQAGIKIAGRNSNNPRYADE